MLTPAEKHFQSLENPLLNRIFGNPELGVHTGQIIELRGASSNGKSLIGAVFAGTLLQTHATIPHWLDLENSWSDPWMLSRGLDRQYVNLYQPFLGLFQSTDDDNKLGKREIAKMLKDGERSKLLEKARIQTAEEILADVELGIRKAHAAHPENYQVLVVDSVAGLAPAEELEHSYEDANMRSRLSLPVLLSSVLKKWMASMTQYRCTVLLLNQVRINPMGIGSAQQYSPGGQALTFYPHVRLQLHRKSGFWMQGTKRIGIQGRIKVTKHKADGQEGDEIGYRIPWDGPARFFEIDND